MKRLPILSPVLALLLSLFIAGPTVTAQTATATLPGITVSGQGGASAPAETATVVIMLGTDPAMSMDPGGMATPAPSAQDIAAPIVAALVAAGVPAGDIDALSNPYAGGYGPYGSPAFVTIRFTLADPTVEGISELLDAAIAASNSAGFFINMMSAVYGIADCSSLQRQAREAAIADARENGSLQAELLNISPGDVIASRDTSYPTAYGGAYVAATQVNSCTIGGADPATAALYGGSPFDPSLPAEVTIQAYVELTFGIEPGPGAASTAPTSTVIATPAT